MAIIDTINRVLREFKRYTGDGLAGEPTGASLPIGDPSSGVHNPKKSELRALFAETAATADAAAAEAAASAELAQEWAETASELTIPSDSLGENKLAQALALTLAKICYTRAELKAVDTARYNVAYLAEPGFEGIFNWRSGDQSAKMVRQTRLSAVVESTDTITQNSVTSTSIDATTETITVATGVPFVDDEELNARTTANGIQINGKYFAKSVTATTFQITVRAGAGAFNLTGTTALNFVSVHKLVTGEAITPSATAHGLTAGTIYYVIRTGPHTFKVATTYANARAGTAIDLSVDGAITWRLLADPLGGRFITKNGTDIGGVNGAWERDDTRINVRHFGAVADGLDSSGAVNAHAIQAVVFLNKYLRLPAYAPGGLLSYKTDWPIEHLTDDQLYGVTVIQTANNGLTLRGDGREMTTIECSSNFPDSTFLLKLDGNLNGVAKVVGSRPMAQTSNVIEGIRFRGRVNPSTGAILGTSVGGASVRGCYEMTWDDVDFESFSGNMVQVFTAAVANPDDEVDNTGFWEMHKVRMAYGGAKGLVMTSTRVAAVNLKEVQIFTMASTGVVACLVNSTWEDVFVTACGNRADTTTGGIRLNDADTASLCRNNTFISVHCEQNFNYEFNFIGCRSLTLIEPGVNIYEPAGGVVANKVAFRIASAGAGTTKDIKFIGGYFQDTPVSYEVPYIDIGSGVEGVSISGCTFVHATSHIQAVAPVRLVIDKVPDSTAVALSGSAPVESYKNGVAL